MTGKRGEKSLWSRTSIAIRQDILKQALVSGVDINEVCNQALASATGIHYAPPQLEPEVPPSPVIVAKDGAPAGLPITAPPLSLHGIHPVINADDPRSASVVKQVPRPAPQKVPTALPGRVSPLEKAPAAIPPDPLPVPPRPKTKKPAQKKPVKAGKGSAIKRFISEATRRGDTDGRPVTKEDFYQAFASWCREHRISPVPDRKTVTIALKNRFAVTEKTIEGEPVWMNIRLR